LEWKGFGYSCDMLGEAATTTPANAERYHYEFEPPLAGRGPMTAQVSL
jgi:hypothetical protein